MFDQGDGNTVIQNLQVHSCPDESKAIELMMIGNEIRHMSSTPMNMNSSRSHSIFTIIIECKNKEDGTEFRSKLHLVDLAGSERMSKGYVEGNQITETKHINKSLSYLEQVIKCLKDMQQGKAIHVPYRNSLMTMLLKDSLGGNCRTSLITCLSTDVENFEETISTCRFGQRCGQLENVVKKNEVVDYPTMVKRLKSENALLMK
jgi:kinesin family protein 6/9